MASATSRLRPMILTAISTVLGLIPIAPTVFWGPMAFAIMGGLLVATLLTLILLPVLYVTVFGNEKPAASRSAACRRALDARSTRAHGRPHDGHRVVAACASSWPRRDALRACGSC